MNRLCVALFLALALPSMAEDVDTIRKAQGVLQQLGHYDGPVDGLSNSSFEAAVRKFQISKGLDGTGVITDETRLMLDEAIRPDEGNTLVAVPRTTTQAPAEVTVVPPAPVRPAATPPSALPVHPPTPPVQHVQPPVAPPSSSSIASDRELLAGGEEAEEAGETEEEEAEVEPLFVHTAFAEASPEVQQRLLSGAASVLRRQGLLSAEDGDDAAALEEALIRYQSSEGLPLSGRLDEPTASAMRLSPGGERETAAPPPRDEPGVYRGRVPRSTPPPDVVRGIWIR